MRVQKFYKFKNQETCGNESKPGQLHMESSSEDSLYQRKEVEMNLERMEQPVNYSNVDHQLEAECFQAKVLKRKKKSNNITND